VKIYPEMPLAGAFAKLCKEVETLTKIMNEFSEKLETRVKDLEDWKAEQLHKERENRINAHIKGRV
jgi:hypothetical protein